MRMSWVSHQGSSKKLLARRSSTLKSKIDCCLPTVMSLVLERRIDDRDHRPIHSLEGHSEIELGVIEALDGAYHEVVALGDNLGQRCLGSNVFGHLLEVRE